MHSYMGQSTHTIASYSHLSHTLKGTCVTYVLEYLADECDPGIIVSFTKGLEWSMLGAPVHSEETAFAILKLDDFILFGSTRAGDRVLNLIIDDAPISAEERAILIEWRKRAFQAFFEIVRIDDDSVCLLDMLAEVSYIVHTNDRDIAERFFSNLQVGSFIYSNIVPIHDAWFFSGIQRRYTTLEAPKIIGALIRNPSVTAMYRNNAAKLERARATQREEYDRFVRHFKTDEIYGSGKEIGNQERAYYTMRAAELGHQNAPIPMIDDETEREQDVALVMDMHEGSHYLFGYKQFVDIFSQNVATLSGLAIVRGYLVDKDIPAFVFQRMRDRFPEHYNSVIQKALDTAYEFDDPTRDFEHIMDYFKPSWRETYPSIHVISEHLLKYHYTASGSKRNDPCPCGSGKKFKKCHNIL